MARMKEFKKEDDNAVTVTEAELPAAPATDNWDTVPERNSLIMGSQIKFKFDEKYFTIDGVKADPSDTYAVLDALAVWVKWGDVDGAPPLEHRVTRPGQRHPERHEMPDQDETEWQIGRDGKPEDPWKNNRYVMLVNMKTAAEATFITDTIGGRRAVSDLKTQILNMRRARPGVIPIVKLVSGMMPTQYGSKAARPEFKVVDWRGGTNPNPAPADPKPPTPRTYPADRITSGLPPKGDDIPPDDGAPPVDTIPPERDPFDDIPL